ncbi:MAG TPA: transferrin-binding protein-like solute binding protein [Rhizomicrobium sp.]|nr:transferrin-binding protein-like solute binding protein [Rhizomicrobium sp.]
MIAAPLAASLGGNAPLTASGATPNFANLPTGTVFPLNQSNLMSDPMERTVTGFTYASGATLTFLGNKQVSGVNVGTFEFKFANDDITLTGDGSAATIANSGNTQIGLTTSNLNYTLLATWVIPTNNGLNVTDLGMGVGGFQTPASGVPTSGTATYLGNGGVTGTVVTAVGTTTVNGDATVTVNFGAGSFTGALTNMNVATAAGPAPWNGVNLSGSLSGATLSGSTAATSAPSGGVLTFGTAATGTFNGALYGPGGQELGAVWSLHDTAGGGSSALGLIGATKQ